MAKGKRQEELQEISGQEVTKYMFIAIGAIIAVGLLIAGGLNLYFMIAKSESSGPREPVEAVEKAPIVEEIVEVQNETATEKNVTEINVTIPEVIENQTITQNTTEPLNKTNQTVSLEVTNTSNSTNTSSAVKYNFDQLNIKLPDTLNYTKMGKVSYHYINITKPDNTPVLNSEGFEVKVTLKPSQGMTTQITPQYEKGQWLISFYPTSQGVNTLIVTVGCKDSVNYCSRIFSGTPKTEQTQFTIS